SPFTGDALPIIDETPEVKGCTIAAGHEGDGIALSPITGKLVADLVEGKENVLLHPLTLSRFTDSKSPGKNPSREEGMNMPKKLGILLLDTIFHRPMGDIGNPSTFPFPVDYKIVEGAMISRIVKQDTEMSVIDSFVAAGKELEKQGVK